MEQIYTCKYCNKSFENIHAKCGHQGMCKLNPNAQERRKKISTTLKGKGIGNPKPKQEYAITCIGCGQEFKLLLTENAFNNKRYKRYCQRCQYQDKGIPWNKGLTKQTDIRVKKNGESIHLGVITGKIVPPQLGKSLSKQHRLAVSEGMKKAHKEGRAWNIGMSRWNSEMSYPQKFFTMVIANQFKDKNYKHQYPVGKYSLDFAWVDKKKCIQIDGQQHLKEDAIQHDRIRDQYLVAQDWNILRISWKQMCNDFKGKIKIAKQFIDF